MIRALLMLAAAATATPRAIEDAALAIAPCVEDPGAECWQDARVLRRFAGERRMLLAPVEAELRLAHDRGDLLVRSADLPPDTTVEISLNREPDKDHTITYPSLASYGEAGPGVQRMSVDPPLQSGELRGLRVMLSTRPEGEVPVLRSWAPHGPGDLARPAPLLVAEADSPELELALSASAEGWTIEVPGATVLELERLPHNPASASIDDLPVSLESTGETLEVAGPPRSGWYAIRARVEEDDRVLAMAQWRVYARPEVAAGSSPADMLPAPRELEWGAGRFRVVERSRICLGGEDTRAAAVLLAEELRRFTAQPLPLVECTPGAGDLGLALGDPELPAEGFRLEIDRRRAQLVGADARGLIYGALALADAIGPDGAVPALSARDHPDSARRVLYHAMHRSGMRVPVDPELYRSFLRRAVARGRFNTLVLMVDGAYRYETVPELSGRDAMSRAQLQRILEAAWELGMEVVPGAQNPGHAGWITRPHPELMEDANPNLLCLRHPGRTELLAAAYEELMALFGEPDWFHIGHDEARWRTRRYEPSTRCPRCAGVPAWQLFSEDLRWQAEFFAERGVRPVMWADMLVPGHNGGAMGTARSLDLLPEELQEHYVLMSWSRRGDPEAVLAGEHDLIRGHTGYHEVRRRGIRETAPEVMGEGMALTFPVPWSAFGPSVGAAAQDYSWQLVLLAGATAWRHDLVDTPLDVLVDHLVTLPAGQPGLGVREGPSRAVALSGSGIGPEHMLPPLPAAVDLYGAPLRLDPRVARAGEPVELELQPGDRHLSLLQAAIPTHEGTGALRRGFRDREATRQGAPVARLVVEDAAGEPHRTELWYGMDLFRPYGDGPIRTLWRTSGSLSLASEELAASHSQATDLSFARRDLALPLELSDPTRARLEVLVEGVDLLLLGATAWQED